MIVRYMAKISDCMIFISHFVCRSLLRSVPPSLHLSITHTHTHTHTHTLSLSLFFFLAHLLHSLILVLLHPCSSYSFLTLYLYICTFHKQQCCWIQLLRLRALVQWCDRQGHASRDLCRCCLLSKTQVK